MRLILLFVLFRMMVVPPLHADTIGDITNLRGYGQVLRDLPYEAVLNFDINSYDDVQTRKGRIEITFLDESTVRLTEHSNLVIDEYIYDPNPTKGKMALSFASGTIRFVSGNINKLDKSNISLKTPTADIAVRGTDFTCTVDETGRSLIILLPDINGDASGEIIVSTLAGQVILDQPYQATTTTVYEQIPTSPVTLDITLDLIDNMLIVAPPKEQEVLAEEEVTQQQDFLDFTDLDVDYLNEDLLAEEDLYFDELDVDYLNTNFFEDLLDAIYLLEEEQQQDVLGSVIDGIDIVGTQIGQDPNTQITTFISGEQINFLRNVTNSLQLTLNSDQSYSILIVQDGITNTIKVNGANSSSIIIKQGQ